MPGGRRIENDSIDLGAIRDSPQMAKRMPENRHFLETGSTVDKVMIDRARQDPAGQNADFQTLFDDLIEHSSRAKILQKEARSDADDLTTGRRYTEHLMQVLSRVGLDREHPAPPPRELPGKGGSKYALADATLTGDDYELSL
jgi:D-alanyl-D-alanine dipeptidase